MLFIPSHNHILRLLNLSKRPREVRTRMTKDISCPTKPTNATLNFKVYHIIHSCNLPPQHLMPLLPFVPSRDLSP